MATDKRLIGGGGRANDLSKLAIRELIPHFAGYLSDGILEAMLFCMGEHDKRATDELGETAPGMVIRAVMKYCERGCPQPSEAK